MSVGRSRPAPAGASSLERQGHERLAQCPALLVWNISPEPVGWRWEVPGPACRRGSNTRSTGHGFRGRTHGNRGLPDRNPPQPFPPTDRTLPGWGPGGAATPQEDCRAFGTACNLLLSFIGERQSGLDRLPRNVPGDLPDTHGGRGCETAQKVKGHCVHVVPVIIFLWRFQDHW